MSKFASLKRRYDNWAYNRLSRGIVDTPPIIPANDGLVIFSMIGTAVLLPYLVAVKSLHHQLKRGRIVILDDGTLTAADKMVLAKQCGNPEIHHIKDVDTGPCPHGGCWERFLTILAIRDADYVIQLDSDTVTIGPIPEIAEAVAANLSFSLSGGEVEAPLGFLVLPEFGQRFYPNGPIETGHVQAILESRLVQMPDAATRRYARACAGFAGFAKGGPGIEAAHDFSQIGDTLTGGRWAEWGTEQAASNYVIANEADSILLRYDRYMNYWAEPWGGDTRFVHFVGAHRFDKGAYASATLGVIKSMK